ncbi:sulfatase family protein [Maribellus maritimus]|uniref:sulfatase family protein n=1 Tax=Maribellus maritimus TaxID=2870838 RepID=UPI001EEA21DE|nr:sulfatase [Maribellus maritimus]MCG6186304.1 sulfatase [Maribellus maritimus]
MKLNLTLLLLLICPVLWSQPKPQISGLDKTPNILIIIADDCTYSDLPLYGGTNVKTPQIDKLASQGMTFNRAFVTMSMCVPCRAELYTGLQPATSGVCWNHSIARSGTTSIVQYLGDLGYRVGIAGKVHANPREVYPFEMIDGVERDCVSKTAGYDAAGLRDFITKNRKQPFCLVTALVVPHIPWTVGDPSHFDPEKLNLPEYVADTKEMRSEFTKYLAEIEVLDQQIGTTLDLLKEEGIEDNTIVIFTSEQGSQIPGCKWTNWNNGVHTGLIVRWPGKVKSGTCTNALIQYNDVLPTLLDALDYKTSAGFDGSSFLPVLLGEKDTHREFAYFMHNNVPEGPPYPIRSITDGKYHYIKNLAHENLYIEKHLMARMTENQYWPSWIFEASSDQKILDLVTRYQKRPPEELYDMTSDSNEMNNLSNREGFTAIQNKLSKKLDEWMTKQGDPGTAIDSFEELNNARKGNHFEN